MNKPAKNTDLNLQVLASIQLTGTEGLPVGFAFRTEALDGQDSGWNFWSGEESEEFIKNSENFVRYPLKHFIELDPSLSEIVDAETGSSWERDPEDEGWIRAED